MNQFQSEANAPNFIKKFRPNQQQRLDVPAAMSVKSWNISWVDTLRGTPWRNPKLMVPGWLQSIYQFSFSTRYKIGVTYPLECGWSGKARNRCGTQFTKLEIPILITMLCFKNITPKWAGQASRSLTALMGELSYFWAHGSRRRASSVSGTHSNTDTWTVASLAVHKISFGA